MPDFLVAAVGDSVMWGQGLLPQDKFMNLAATNIAKQLNKTAKVQSPFVHSGAKLIAPDPVPGEPTARESFVDAHPNSFQDPERKKQFLAGTNEEMITLFGEVPAGFPTIDFQVDWIPRAFPQEAVRTDLLLINGGANNVDFEEVLDPENDNFVGKFDPPFRRYFFVEMKKLLRKARKNFPNAVIVVTGYYAPFSEKSDEDDFEEFIEDMSGKPEILIHLNDLTGTSAFRNSIGAVLGWFDIDSHIDIDDIARQITRQAALGQSRGVFWLQRAVSELIMDPEVRGPGIIFVNPGFGPDNALFAKNPFVHDRYEEPIDKLKDLRKERGPRSLHLDTMKTLHRFMMGLLGGSPQVVTQVKDFTNRLLEVLDGPTSLRQALIRIADDVTLDRVRDAFELLKDEIGKIELCRIASFIHPNEAGAKRYADVITERSLRHARGSLRESLLDSAGTTASPAGILSASGTFAKYGFSLENGLRACMPHAIVDSIAVEIATATDSESVLSEKVELDIGLGRTWILDHFHRSPSPHFQPGAHDLFTIDTLGDLRLADIRHLQLRRKGNDLGFWKPSRLTLWLNGLRVFHTDINRPIKSGETITLAYPA